MASIEAIKNREIRGCILRALAKTQFRAISDHSLGPCERYNGHISSSMLLGRQGIHKRS